MSAVEFVCTLMYFQVGIQYFLINNEYLLSVSTDQVPRCSLEISNKPIHSNTTSLDVNQQISLELTIKVCINTLDNDEIHIHLQIPKPFHCTLASGYKWLEVSAMSGANLSPIHFFATENGEKTNPFYLNINRDSLT